jgi:hypothetical protein
VRRRIEEYNYFSVEPRKSLVPGFLGNLVHPTFLTYKVVFLRTTFQIPLCPIAVLLVEVEPVQQFITISQCSSKRIYNRVTSAFSYRAATVDISLSWRWCQPSLIRVPR